MFSRVFDSTLELCRAVALQSLAIIVCQPTSLPAWQGGKGWDMRA
jgi:hypothetical protein